MKAEFEIKFTISEEDKITRSLFGTYIFGDDENNWANEAREMCANIYRGIEKRNIFFSCEIPLTSEELYAIIDYGYKLNNADAARRYREAGIE